VAIDWPLAAAGAGWAMAGGSTLFVIARRQGRGVRAQGVNPGRRRSLMAAIGAAAVVAQGGGRHALAQTPTKTHRVGVLAPDASDVQGEVWQTFVDELATRGYVQGRNLVFETRLGGGDKPELVEQAAAALVALKPDVIYAARGSMSALAAKRATSTIPIVFYSSGDPVSLGLVASLARPGGNVTGSSVQGFDIIGKAMQLLGEALGKVRRVVYLQPAGSRAMPWFTGLEQTLVNAAKTQGASVEFVDVDAFEAIEPLARRLARERVDAVIVSDFPLFKPRMAEIAAIFSRHRLPAYGNAYVGFLMHYGEQRNKLARMAAAYVDRILGGAKPAELPVEQLSTFELVINMKTAKALNIKLPRALLLRADSVIE
jgi:putative tryptophan/tyrosine transport system substrate-binding protein